MCEKLKYKGAKIVFKQSVDTRVDIFFKGGHFLDGGIAGLSHFVEHTIEASSMMNRLDELKIELDACVGATYTQYTFDFDIELNKKKEKSIEKYKKQFGYNLMFIKDFLFDSNYDNNFFENIKKIIGKEQLQAVKDSQSQAINNFSLQLWSKVNDTDINFYNSFGNEESLKNVTMADIDKFKQNYYTAQNSTIIVQSPLSSKELEKIVEKCFIDYLPNDTQSKVVINNPKKILNSEYHIFKEKAKADEAVVASFVSCGDKVGFLESSLVTLIMEKYSNKSGYSGISNIEKFFRGFGVAYSVDESEANVDGKYVSFLTGFETSKQDVAKSLRLMAIYNNIVLSEIQKEEVLYKIKKEILEDEKEENEESLSECEIDSIFSSVNNLVSDFKNQITPKLQKLIKHYSIKDLKEIIQNFKENVVLNNIVAGDVELNKLPNIEFLSDIVKGQQKEIYFYVMLKLDEQKMLRSRGESFNAFDTTKINNFNKKEHNGREL